MTILISNEAMLPHDGGPGHPERPERLRAILDELKARPVAGSQFVPARPASRKQIERVHDSRYIDFIDSLRGQSAQLDEDTAVSPGSVEAVYVAAGAAVQAVECVMNGAGSGGASGGKSGGAFALVRPPGHHAEADRAMGFCLFNNIAIAAAHAIAEYGCKRVMIVDWDVHHGNGTQHIFEKQSLVLFFSSHQWPLWPGTGALNEVGRGEGEGFTVNAPLPAGFDDAGYVELFGRLVIPMARQYQPELVLVSAGFDAHRDDPLGGMKMSEDGFAALCAMMRNVAGEVCAGRLVLILEGGYNLKALARSVRACVEVMAGGESPSIEKEKLRWKTIIDEIVGFHRRYWPGIE